MRRCNAAEFHKQRLRVPAGWLVMILEEAWWLRHDATANNGRRMAYGTEEEAREGEEEELSSWRRSRVARDL